MLNFCVDLYQMNSTNLIETILKQVREVGIWFIVILLLSLISEVRIEWLSFSNNFNSQTKTGLMLSILSISAAMVAKNFFSRTPFDTTSPRTRTQCSRL